MARANKDNVGQLRRALNERDEARAFQAATDEILTAISRSTSDAKPVFDAIVRNVPRLFDTRYVAVFLIKGEVLHLAAAKADATFQRRHGTRFRRFQESFPQPIHWGGFTGKALRSGKVSQIGPIIGNPKASPQAVKIAKEFGYNTMLVAPLMRGGKAIGAIGTTRPGVKLFSAKELALFKAFAAQAVIAIENARLFNETKEALEQQTATAEILKVISASPTSTQPVFESIVNNCGVLFKDSRVALWQISEGRLLPRASTGYMPEPMPLDRQSAVGACVLEARTIHFADLRSAAEQHPRIKQLGLKHGYLSGVFAPLMREGQAIGAISVLRRELGAFSDKEVALLGTFADQAVIAIENARLFNETKEALEQQTTTAGVLRVIAGSPSDLKPVMNAVVEKAARLLEADHALIGQSDGENIHWLAAHGCPVPDGARSITRELPSGRAILDLQTTQIEDIGKIERDSLLERSYGRFGVRTICATPLIREGRAVGVILLRRTQVRPFTEKQMSLLRTFADQAVIAIENARLFNETKEALEQQTASSEILGVISTSPTDLRPVFDAILESATRLCDAHLGVLNLFEGEMCRTVAQRGGSPEFAKWVLERGAFKPVAAMARILADRRPFHVPDAREGPGFKARDANAMKFVELGAVRTYLAVPLLKEGAVIGSINIFRPQIRPFTDKQIALVSTFANQAVIAIENVRLFNETKEALERQTATSEILKAIAGSVRDVQPVFEAIVTNATDLCEAQFGALFLVSGELWRMVSHRGASAAAQEAYRSFRAAPTTGIGRMVRERKPIHIQDLLADAATAQRDPLRMATIEKLGARTFLAVPLLKDGDVIGAVVTYRKEVRPFGEAQIRLLATFADQAVIAIENARLFNETNEALEQQKAMSEILRTISRSPTDLQPVFDTILAHAIRLGEGSNAVLWRYQDGMLRFAAEKNCTPQGILVVKDNPLELGDYNPTPQAGLERRTVHVLNVFEEPRYRPLVPLTPGSRGSAPTVLAVPLLKDDELLGVVSIWRRESPIRLFTEKQVAMVETFAAQAVIAIENVRLFNETREALERQTATAEILRVISGSPTDTRPVFDVIAKSGLRLFGGLNVAILLRREKEFVLAGYSGPGVEDLPEQVRTAPLDPEKNFPSRAILEGKVLNVTDWEGGNVPEHERLVARSLGIKSGVMVPLLRQGEGIGAIAVLRATEGPFIDKDIALLQSFADQAVIAIENVRLFNETKEALEQQTAISEVLRVISSSPTDVQPVLEAVAERAMRICDAKDARIFLVDGQELRYAAGQGDVRMGEIGMRRPLDRGLVMGRAVIDREPVQVEDLERAGEEFPLGRQAHLQHGHRTALAVPLLREKQALGAILLRRMEVRPFSEKQIALLKTFADQAAIAIENVRLFNETREALERQTATGEILASISSAIDDTQPVFDAIVESLRRLLNTHYAVVSLIEDGKGMWKAMSGDKRITDRVKAAYPWPVNDERRFVSRAIQSGEVVQLCPLAGNPEAPETSRQIGLESGYDAILVAPLVRAETVIGYIVTTRAEAIPFNEKQVALIKSFADQAVIAIENVRLFNETKEALERQTATAEILKVISASPSDVQPVFDAVAENAARVCGVDDVAILRVEGGDLRRVAHYGAVPVSPDSLVPVPPGSVNQRVLSERRTLHIPDTLAASFTREFPGSQFPAMGVRALLATPLVHDGVAVGVIHLRRSEPRPFTDKQIALLETFAAQAVIAIENVRLFNETREALERQTATGEILASISGSMTDTKPVFDAIVRNLMRLFSTGYAVVSLKRGEIFELGGFRGEPGFERLQDAYPMPVDGNTIIGEVLIEQRVAKYAPIAGNPAVPRRTVEIAQRFGFNSVMAAPMMWKGEAIGVILTARRQALPFDDKQVALIQSFADQAVIAIENVRLFKELQERTEALTKSVSQLTALGEVGQAISSSLELETVLKTIVQRAVELAGLDGGSIYEFDEGDGRFHLRAAEHVEEEILAVSRNSPIRLGEGVVGRAGATREPVVVEDVLDESYKSRVRELLIKSGSRALLAVPLLREDFLLGALVVYRKSPGPFAPEVIELLKTFATQSAVAIQNARLFREIAEKSSQLEEASRHKSQFLASMSHELRTPLNAILGFNEMILGQVYGEVPSDMKEPLEDIQKSGKHLLRLINNVLDLAKIEAGKMELSLADYSVHDTVESVRSTLRPLAEAKGLELVASVPEDLPLAYGDGGRLTQCLMNLAGNSLKFTKEGRVEIAVEAENGCLRWRVSDTGIGIPADKIPTLFSEFKQTDATIASEYGGTGLGLSITKKFVEMHGGRIWVESELGKGSVFTLEIPLRVTGPA